LLRPLWLIDPPVALSERNNRPFWESPLSLLAGPERIESGWWDDKLVLRDYFIAEDTSHRLLWIFRERLSDTGKAWYLHGRFG
ncbi:MAG: DNA polymerase Y family protein, partial [Betaproteobacteria bacterium]